MTEEPLREDPLADLFEVCRLGGEDLGDPALALLVERLAVEPELAERLEAIQRADAAVERAFADVPVPDGLAARILARLGEAASEPSRSDSGACRSQIRTPLASHRRTSRRRWLLSAVGVSAAALLVTVGLFQWQVAAVYTHATVLERALERFATEGLLPGKPLDSAPAAYPFSNAVAATHEVRWRPLDDFLDRRGAAYDLTGVDGTRATLYVVRHAIEGIPPAPSPRPALTTGGRSASAWQSDRCLYVLVVDGPPETYLRFLNLPTGPLT